MNNVVLAHDRCQRGRLRVRLLEVLLAAGRNVHLVISPAAAQVLDHELGLKVDLDHFRSEQLLPRSPGAVDPQLQLLRSRTGPQEARSSATPTCSPAA